MKRAAFESDTPSIVLNKALRRTWARAARGWLTGCGMLMAVSSPSQVPALQPGAHPAPSGVLATLYDEPAQAGSGSEVTSIHRVAGFENRLFVALTDSAGHELLEVWDTRNLSRPERVSSVDFGSVLTNGVMFTPLALVPFHGGLLLQTRAGLTLHRFLDDGRLVFERELPPPTTGLGLPPTQLHLGGRHASLLQQVIPDPLISGQNLEQVHREVLLDLANPERPKLLWGGFQGASVTHADPVNAVLGGNPASLAWDPPANRVRLTVFERGRPSRHEVFWLPKLRRLFAADVLDRPLRDLLQRALESVRLEALQADGMRLYAEGNGPGEVTLAARILEHQAVDRRLRDVLAEYGIALEDPLEMAVAKVVAAKLDGDLEARLGAAWYAVPLQAWLETLVAPGVPLRSLEEARAAIAGVFDAEWDEQTLARYLTVHVISPLLGSPAFMELRLGELIDDLVNSPAGALVDVMLRTAGGFGAVNALLDTLRGLIDLLPGIDLSDLPECARFPDSARALIDLALFSWADPARGLALDREGLAWFELLKFHRYLGGHTDFPDYTAGIAQRLRDMQESLAGNLAMRLSEAFALPGAGTDLPALHATVAAERQARYLAGRLLAEALLGAGPGERGFTASMTVGAALGRLGLHVGEAGVRESTVADLVASLEVAGLGGLRLGELFSRAAATPSAAFVAGVEQVLRRQVQASFGGSSLDLSLADLVRPSLDFDVGVQDVVGDWMAGLLNGLVADGPGMSGLLLEARRAFEHRDCIAQWLVVLDIVAGATAWVGGDAVALALEYALSEAYRAGVASMVNTMFGALIREVVGGFGGNESLWLAAQLEPRTAEWTALDPVAGAVMTTLGAFAWQERVGCVVQERLDADWFGPRRLRLVLCHPADPVGTRQVYDLGRWQAVNVVTHHAGALLVGGSCFTGSDGAFPTGKALIVDVDAREPRVQVLAGDAHLPLGSAPILAGANHDACLAVGALNRVFILPSPAGALPSSLEPAAAPRLVEAPRSVNLPAGTSHDLVACAVGTAPFTWRWSRDGIPLPRAEGPRLRIDATGGVETVEYSVVVSNVAGTASASATVRVLAEGDFRIVRQPGDLVLLAGQGGRFDVGVEGGGTPAFQWYRDGRRIAGATGPHLALANLDAADAGEYCVEVAGGEVRLRSRAARLAIVDSRPPVFVRVPASRQPAGVGATTSLTAAAVGWGELTYVWSREGAVVPGVEGSDLILGPVDTRSAGDYRVEAWDAGGRVSAHAFTVVLAASARVEGRLNERGHFVVSIAGGVPGQAYSLLGSTNLVDWSELRGGVFPPGGAVEHEDGLGATAREAAFYQLRVMP